ncbi:LysR family transcriptional regulator [Kribbella qitaiheensis]|nr:LysR family transcriptional regulator [Kribbella qitaiheensis]
MELRQLEYFVAVAHERSFTLAAQRLHVDPSWDQPARERRSLGGP